MGNASVKDLCSTCVHADTCVRRAGQDGPVWYCEEFDDYQPPISGNVRGATDQSGPASKKPGSDESGCDQSLGLCCNCKNRDTCTYPRPNGGVWHCEDYA